jgi:hypothetical protein
MRFSASGFSRKSTPYGLQIHTLNYLRIGIRLREDIQKVFSSAWSETALSQNIFKFGKQFLNFLIMLGLCMFRIYVFIKVYL